MQPQAIPKYDEYDFTGAAAIASAIAPTGAEFRLAGFSIHASAALAAEDITFTVDSRKGANYDAEILSVDLDGLTSKVHMIPFDERVPLKSGDEIDVAHTNTNLRTYGLTVFIERE